MNKSQNLIELLRYVNLKKEFTAQEVADEFNISVRTVHRYLLELSDLGVYFYTEQGKHGGYRLISSRILPPVNFTEDEALSIFFAFQALNDYSEIPFDVDIQTVSRKLYTNLPIELQQTVDKMKSVLAFRNIHQNVSNKYLKQILYLVGSQKIINIEYQKINQIKSYKLVPICVYSNNGYWYVPSYDLNSDEIKHYRIDRIISIQETHKTMTDCSYTIEDCFNNYLIKDPIHLYVKLDELGIKECQNNLYLSQDIQFNNDNKTGYIDEMIDRRDIKYLGDFFLRLGPSAEVIEPIEIRKYILHKINDLIKIYHTNNL